MPATSRMVIDGGDELKTSWPEVCSSLEPHLVGEVPGPGYDPKRVRIFVDTFFTVVQTPVVG
nr:unnamed protein product [Digitaria exilis]